MDMEMITQPLKQYLDKHVQYKPNNEYDPSRHWIKVKSYDSKYELIKIETRSHRFNMTTAILFQRYMNQSCWYW